MSEENALLQAIIANPDEDTPRLMYADWIEERGYPERAELIRVQVGRGSTAEGSPDYFRNILRAAELLALNRERWTADFERYAKVTHIEFARGLPEAVTMDAADFLRSAAVLFMMAPLREVWLRSADAHVLAVCREPRPSGTRVRAEVSEWFDVDREYSGGADYLRPAPDQLELHLRRGRWLVLAFAVWSIPDRQTASRFLRYTTHGYGGEDADGPLSHAVRPYDRDEEFASWCPRLPSVASPRWLWFEDGQLVRYQVGAAPPAEWEEEWEYV